MTTSAAKPSGTLAKFHPGTCVATPAAKRALDAIDPNRLYQLLTLHCAGDWGVVDEEDRRANNAALYEEPTGRILSAYAIDPDRASLGHGPNTVWIITEWDRSATTVLLPEEY